MGLQDRLRIHREHIDLGVRFGIFARCSFLVSDGRHGILQDFYDATLAGEGKTDDHETVSNLDHIVQFEGLLDDFGC